MYALNIDYTIYASYIYNALFLLCLTSCYLDEANS